MISAPATTVQHLTILPTQIVQKVNAVGGTIIVNTPDKGKVLIDFQTPESVGFIFTHTENRDTRVEEIITEVLTLEKDAKQFLLEQWVKKNEYDRTH